VKGLIRPDYTDLAVVFGPNMRWVREDYDDLQKHAPEVLLGYRVRLATPYDRLWGFWITKLVLLEGPYRTQDWSRIQDAVVQTELRGGRVETYNIYRGQDPIVRRVA
jgi:hypothetical protein